MRRFLILKRAKEQFAKWLSLLDMLSSHHKESHHEQEQVHAIEPETVLELDGKAAVTHGFASVCALHSESHVPAEAIGRTAMNPSSQQSPQFEIRFRSLYNEGRALSFPCDAQGHVEMDALSEKARVNYLYARAVVGREFAAPAVQEAELH